MITANMNSITIDFNPFETDKEIEKIVAINESQREIWLSCAIGGEAANLAYNESVSLKLNGHLSLDHLNKAFSIVVQRHEALRSSISNHGEHFIIYKAIDFEVETISLVGLSPSLQSAAIDNFVEAQMLLPFDLQEGPLFRVYIHQISPLEHYFTITIHHIICDGWSTGIILENLSKAYNALTKGLLVDLPPVIQISDYATQQFKFLNSDEFKETENFWLKLYDGEIPSMDLPADFERGASRTYKAARKDYILPADLIVKLKDAGSKAGCSLVNTMFSLFEIFISQYSKQNNVIVGLPAAGQLATDNHELVGHCVNILPIRSKVDKTHTFLTYLKQSRKGFLDAYDHQMFSFGQLLKKLNFKRDGSRIPLVPIVFNIDMGMDAAVAFDELSYDLISNPRAYETFEIFLNVTGNGDTLVLEWSYNTQLFKEDSIDRMFGEFQTIINNFVRNPEDLIFQHDSNAALNFGIASSIGPTVTSNKTLIDLLQVSSSKFAKKTAINFNDESYSYEEIENQTNSLAAFLIEKGIGKGDVVAIATERSSKMLISLLAIMKTGAAYLPIDPEYPKDRIEFMLEDSGAKLLLSSQKYHSAYKTVITKLILEDIWSSLKSANFRSNTVNMDDLAYILYTSGSTGKPKGVQITHQNLVNFLMSMQVEPGISPSDCLLAITTISFDIAGLELFLPLVAGAELVIADSESVKDGRLLLSTLEQRSITMMQATPSTWQMILDSGWTKPLPVKILCGGEALSKDLASKLLKLSSELWNMYGPTETTIWSTSKRILSNDEIVTIGAAIQNTSVFILNEENLPLAINEIGEICIGGKGVAKGYLNRTELTAEKFINHFSSSNINEKLYKTGDLGKILPNGEIVCLGRIDQQVKIRGHRIELEEIEAIINQQKGVKQAVVTTHEINTGDKRIIAYVTLTEDLSDIKFHNLDSIETNSTLKRIPKEHTAVWENSLHRHLPAYMVPDFYFVLDHFPLTPNAKIDRKAMPAPEIRKADVFQPQDLTGNEKLIAEIWTEVLGIQNLKSSDDFFELGGHSLLAIKVMVAIEKKTGTRLPLTVLFENSTIKQLASQLTSSDNSSEWKSLIPIRTNATEPPIYIIHGLGMNIMGFRSLAQELSEYKSIYGFQAKGLNPKDEPLDDIEQIAADYIKELLQSNQEGPYSLIGYSSGGIIALEMAYQLEKIGKKISFLGLLDTYAGCEDLKILLREKKYKETLSFAATSIRHFLSYLIKHPFQYLNLVKCFTFKKVDNFVKIHLTKIDKNDPIVVLNKIRKAHYRAFGNYNFKNYTTPVHLFKANDIAVKHIKFADTNGLEPFIQGKIEIISIPLGHLQFFDQPFVKIFANELKKAMYMPILYPDVTPV
ncbi:amino acid adenylation domain-containing protein [Pedobacter agri]|nr:amino acid adenylation domain-containing protein [Pedobacter agri]